MTTESDPAAPPARKPPTKQPSTRAASAPAPASPPPAAAPAPTSPLIPVATLRFLHNLKIDVPGKAATGGVSASSPGAEPATRIFFDPRLRHHRVEHTKAGAKKPQVMYLPEAICTWEPLS